MENENANANYNFISINQLIQLADDRAETSNTSSNIYYSNVITEY